MILNFYNSQISYYVTTGYLKDHISPEQKIQALKIRKKLQKNGAIKIVACMDENSGTDERWHTGHTLQRENYKYLLEKVIEEPWFGVVFKPKVQKTLRIRLGNEVSELLNEAEKNKTEIIIAGAGGAAHLAGVAASLTTLPVLGIPIESKLKGLDSLLSTVQMPSGIPVGTLAIGKAGAINAALLAVSILSIRYIDLSVFCLLAY